MRRMSPSNSQGGLLFRDSPIHAVVNIEDGVEESDEGSNVASLRAVGIDLSASRLEIDDSACPDPATLTVRIGNAGDVYELPKLETTKERRLNIPRKYIFEEIAYQNQKTQKLIVAV